MQIAKDKAVTINYSVSDDQENLIDSSFDDEPLRFIQGSGYLIPGLEAEMEGKAKGDVFSVTVEADQAYGQRQDGFVQEVPKSMFEGVEVQVGMQFRADTDQGEQSVIIIDIADDTVTVDGNHPLAGLTLVFEVEVLEVRDATAEEISHGHVHDEGSCKH